MSEAFRCDKCGEFFEGESPLVISSHDLDQVRDNPVMNILRNPSTYHYCTVCASDVRGFLKGKKDLGWVDPFEVQKAYDERNQVVAALSKVYPSHLVENDDDPDWPIVCIHIPDPTKPSAYTKDFERRELPAQTQVIWHVPAKDVPTYFGHLRYEKDHWDGHLAATNYARLARLEPQQ